MIIFENEGEIDIRAIKTFGVSVKTGDNPIGFFGTGLKYAIAILLRHGHSITIQTGLETYDFGVSKAVIRGADFQIVTMNGEELGFTTDVGKNWKLWMAYRELHCNCVDEGGTVVEKISAPESEQDVTRVIVGGEEFDQVHRRRREFLLSTEPTILAARVHVHSGEAKSVFYRGIRVQELSGRSKFTYNVKDQIDLTEDRTVKYDWEITNAVAATILQSQDRDFVRDCILAEEGYLENGLNYHSTIGVAPGEVFLDVVGELSKDKVARISLSALTAYKNATQSKFAPAEMTLTRTQQAMLDRALGICTRFDFDIDNYEVTVVESLGSGVLGMAAEGNIYIAHMAFDKGTKCVAGTLIEEYVHLKHDLGDCTRGLQDFLLDRMMSLMEENMGEPI